MSDATRKIFETLGVSPVEEERERCARIAERLGHPEVAAEIRKPPPRDDRGDFIIRHG